MGLVGLSLCLTFPATAAENVPFVPGRILLRLRPGVAVTNLPARMARRGASVGPTLHHSQIHLLNLPEAQVEAAIEDLRNDPDTEYAERDYLAQAAFVPDDPLALSGQEWHLASLRAPAAWDITSGRTNVLVAVLDSGIDAAHPDLAGQSTPGYDFVNNTPNPGDDFGHGTAVAGVLAAAGNNGLGIAGIAFGCRVLPVKVMDRSGFAAYSSIAEGIHFAVEQGARVVNISIVGSQPSGALQEAIDFAWSNNVIVVASAGNYANSVPQYPAACDHVLAVSATEPDGSLAWFSSFGTNVTLSAPGDAIWTTQNDTNAPYGPWSGTSLASPLVAGVAALVLAENPALTAAQVCSILEQTAEDLGSPGYDSSFGYGQVDAYAAVDAASQLPGGLPPSPPQVAGSTNFTDATFAGVNPPPVDPVATNLFDSTWKGTYAGLVIDTNGVSPVNSGYFRIVVSASGKLTGKLWAGGCSWGFHGVFDGNGRSTLFIKRGALETLPARLTLNSGAHPDRVSGRITGSGWTSELAGDRNVFDSHGHPARQAGRGAFVLTRMSDSAAVATGLSIIRKGGQTRIRGRLLNGRAFSAASLLAENGDCPLYLSFNRGSEIVIGWMNFPEAAAQTYRGTVLWVPSDSGSSASLLQAASVPTP